MPENLLDSVGEGGLNSTPRGLGYRGFSKISGMAGIRS